ncbi:MAG: hypothetical protein H6730_11860 [Deltaproteobacteria bacterium]|nr:hypothetical protein [Deltaproteobacteria bacterium]
MYLDKHKNTFLLSGLVALGTIGLTSEAHAIDPGTGLVAACALNAGETANMLSQAMTDCSATRGGKSACQVLSGTPFACNTAHPTSQDNKTCTYNQVTGILTGVITLPAGWSINGSVSGTITLNSYWKDLMQCNLIPKSDAKGGPGTYARRAGTVVAIAKLEATADFTMTTPAGGTVQVKASLGCNATASDEAYSTGATIACGEPSDGEDRTPEPPQPPGGETGGQDGPVTPGGTGG